MRGVMDTKAEVNTSQSRSANIRVGVSLFNAATGGFSLMRGFTRKPQIEARYDQEPWAANAKIFITETTLDRRNLRNLRRQSLYLHVNAHA